MIQKMYVIHDSAVKAFVSPHFARTHGEAERNFRLAVNTQDEPGKTSHLSRSPEQFTLFYVGDYDDETGLVTPKPSPEAVITAVQAKAESAA